ncbi:helix-turn-helix transcriptional regulator [Streptosporangium sp. NPDC051022]|uniref:helix-turn-helix domain-containing protein n=1 Tax=Streptosporangium sp. NPDC051022 TaxID=3155752 RepID=UPI00343FEDE4
MTKSPTVRHRRLGRELRRLREAAGLMPEAAARQLGWSRPKVNRIENAKLLPSVVDVGHACDLFGADSATKAGLIQLCKDAAVRGWWTAYSDVLSSSYVVLESEAIAIRTWEPLLIPGLLQNEEYARAIIQAGRPGLDDTELKRRVDARMTRKITLLGSNAPAFHALLDEGALRRPVEPPSVMADQLGDILQVVDRPNVTIQVLPLRAGVHSGLEGAFSVLSFGAEDPDVGYTGSPGGVVYVEAADQVRDLTLTFERLASMALSPEKSADLIAAARSDHE